jgi:hypothetical protein
VATTDLQLDTRDLEARVKDMYREVAEEPHIAALHAGAGGRVIGVDMTDAQLEKARALAREGGLGQVEFRRGYIERPPVDPGRCQEDHRRRGALGGLHRRRHAA